jgi:hypothetical protein
MIGVAKLTHPCIRCGKDTEVTVLVCTTCSVKVGNAVLKLPRYRQGLYSSTGPARIGDGVKTSRLAPQSSPPNRTFIFDLAREIESSVRSWAHIAVTGNQGGRQRRCTFAQAHSTVWGHHHRFMAHPVHVEVYGREMLALERRSLVALRAEALVHHLPAPCPNCDTLGLIRHDGQDQVRCSFCGVSWQANEYDRLVHVLAWEQENLTHA